MRKSLFAIAALLPVVAFAGFKYHDVQATVVSTDAKAHTITLKGDDGTEHTAKVEGKAASELANLKAGEKVTATCKDNDKGDHLAVTVIKANT